jgi:hypothetical protein
MSGMSGSRGSMPSMSSGSMAVVKPSKVVTLEPQVRKTAIRKRILFGPFDFKGASVRSPTF